MTGIVKVAVTARARLACDRCGARWESSVKDAQDRWLESVEWCEEAWSLGWRVLRGERSQRTYCPDCGPVRSMPQIYPRPPRRK